MNNDQEDNTGGPITDKDRLYKKKYRSPDHGKVGHYDLADHDTKPRARVKKKKTRDSRTEMYDNPVYEDGSLNESYDRGKTLVLQFHYYDFSFRLFGNLVRYVIYVYSKYAFRLPW